MSTSTDVHLRECCNICGGANFLPGPGNRLSATRKPPRCQKCQSLERHRTLRRFYQNIRTEVDLSALNCLQISADQAVKPEWFASHAVSIFEGQHSLDICDLPIATSSYGVVICNHVLEHVPNDEQAMSELFRIIKLEGFVQIAVPDPLRMPATNDWGYPNWSDHGHYRKYGMDITEKLLRVKDLSCLLAISESDPVTDMPDLYFILTRCPTVSEAFLRVYPHAKVHEKEGMPRVTKTKVCSLPPVLHAAHRLRAPTACTSYIVEAGHTEVKGWVAEGALSAAVALNAMQRRFDVEGHVCEIGVHHGRYFIALSLLRSLGEKSLAIDVFDEQALNPDQSGCGDRLIFESNVAKWLEPFPDVVTVKADSLTVTGNDVSETLGGKVRLFSIDGSHTREHTLNDLAIAEDCLVDGGVAIVDDFLNPNWPGVLEAVVLYCNRTNPAAQLAPIFYGDNKLYLAAPSWANRYKGALLEIFRHQARTIKEVSLCGHATAHVAFLPPSTALAENRVELGRSLNFGAGAEKVGTAFLIGKGPSTEKTGAWATGEWPGIALCLPADARKHPKLEIELTMSCYRHNLDPEPSVVMWSSGVSSTTIEFPVGTDERNVSFCFDPREYGSANRMELWFHNPRATSPSSLGRSSDTRKLAFHIAALTVKPCPSS